MGSYFKVLTVCFVALLIVILGILVVDKLLGDEINRFWDNDKEITLLDDSGFSEEGVNKIVEGNNKFAFDLFLQYVNDDSIAEGNIFFSPISIHSALSMTYEGANGDTANEISKALYLNIDTDLRLPNYARIFNEINNNHQNYSLNIANALWMQDDYPVKTSYKDVITNFYGGEARNLDFLNETDASAEIINKWIEEKTQKKIKDMFSEGSINSDIRLVLTNAIYFKGDWEIQFDKENTVKTSFSTLDGGKTEVDMMSLKEESFNYYQNDDLQMVEMSYKGDDVSMIVILPRDGKFESVQKMLTFEKYNEWKSSMTSEQVNIYFPKFKFETMTLLKPYLQDMGIVSAFEPGVADFSGIDGTRSLFIDLVIHKAFVEVNEEGTEAAGATGVTVGVTSMPQAYTFRADRPFIFFIQNKKNGNIFFMGRMSDISDK